MDHLNDLNINIDLGNVDNHYLNRSGGGWELLNDHVENWAWSNGYFSNEEIDKICYIGQNLILEKATTIGGKSNVRNSDVSFIFPNNTTSWIFQKLSGVINMMNNQYFKFNLNSMEQGIQYTEYRAPGQHYNWHLDKGVGVRKLSLVMQLSDPSEYEGGELELNIGGDEYIQIEKVKGYIVIFPSYVLHRVKPVTSGLRRSLVCWVSGPPFK